MEILKTNAVRGRLGELKMSIEAFAKAMGRSRNRIYALLAGERPYTAIEIERACEVLGIPIERIPDYFFGTVVSKVPTKSRKERE